MAEDQELLALVERRFAELAESIDESRKETRERFDRTDQRFDRLEAETRERFDRTDQRFDRLEAETGERFDRLEAEARHAHVRIESLEGVVQQVAEGVANVDEKLERFQAEVQGEFKEVRALIGQSYADLDQRVTALEGR